MKVFISYAREDYQTAKKLYDDLKAAEIEPWMDTENLFPGQNWKATISQAINECRYFLALLSNNSLSKKGFVQKELKIALEILDEYPTHEIFLIPIRIEKCEPVEEKLKSLNWADLFPSYKVGLKRLLNVLKRTDNDLNLVDNINQNTINQQFFNDQFDRSSIKHFLRSDLILIAKDELFESMKLNINGRPQRFISNSFQVLDTGTVADSSTGLQWQESGSPARINYYKAEFYVKEINERGLAGYRNWRLPTIEEILTLMTLEKQDNGLYIDPIFDELQQWCWSGDKCSPGSAWFVSFRTGRIHENLINYNNAFVRAVRHLGDGD